MATSIVDATSSASMDSIENLTELDEIKKALEQLGKQEVIFGYSLIAQFSHTGFKSSQNFKFSVCWRLSIVRTVVDYTVRVVIPKPCFLSKSFLLEKKCQKIVWKQLKTTSLMRLNLKFDQWVVKFWDVTSVHNIPFHGVPQVLNPAKSHSQ